MIVWLRRYGRLLLVALAFTLIGVVLSQVFTWSRHLAADHQALHTVDSAVGRLMTHHPEILAEWRAALGVVEESTTVSPAIPPASTPVPE